MSGRISPAWSCPQCGRVVPGREARCHCGVERTEVPAAMRGGGEAPASRGGVGRLVLAVAALAALGFALYAAARQREESLRAAALAESARIHGEPGYPPPPSATAPREAAPRASTPRIPDWLGSSPWPPPSAAGVPSPPVAAIKPTPAAEASPSPTSMEEAWNRATELLEPPLQKIAAETGELQQRYGPFGQTCLASPEGNWLVEMRSGRLVPSGIPFLRNGVTFDCQRERRNLVTRADALKSELDGVERMAHSSGVLPGHWRKLVATHQLDVWDQY